MTFDLAIILETWPLFARGLLNTVLYCAASVAAGLAFAVVVALGRISKRGWLRVPAAAFIEVIRDTPFLVQVYLIFFALPAFGVRLDATLVGIVALSLYGAAYFAESIRGAIASVPRGQTDAARAVGMSYLLAMRRVVFPQMLGYLLPSLANQMIGIVKESAVLSVITVPEITMAGQIVLGEHFSPVEAYLMVALLYWVLNAGVATVMRRLERRTVGHGMQRASAAAGLRAGW